MSIIYTPVMWRYAVVVVARFFYHFDCYDGNFHKYYISTMLGQYENRKYKKKRRKRKTLQGCKIEDRVSVYEEVIV